MTEQPETNDVLGKAVNVLEALSRHPDGLLLHEVASEMQIAKSSLHRILSTWMKLGYVERSGEKRFRVGFKVMEMAGRMQRNTSIVERSRSLLAKLHERFNESVYLGVYRENSVLLVDAIESTKPLRICVDIGEKCWLHASAQGRSVAAWLTREAQDDLLGGELPRITAVTNINPASIAGILEAARYNGYVVNYEETVEGSVCIGVPFFAGRDGKVLGSLGIAIPTVRASERIIADACATMSDIAEEMTERLTGFPAEADADSRTSFMPDQQERHQSGAKRIGHN